MSKFVKYSDIESYGKPENKAILDYPDDEIIIEEKVDGGNGAFWIEDGVIHTASRNRDLTEQQDERTFEVYRKDLLERLTPNKDKINPNYIYYVEWMQKHSIFYGKEMPKVIGLEIRPIEGAFGKSPLYLSRKIKEREFEKLGVVCVHLIGTYKAKEINNELLNSLIQKSVYYDGLPEGIVLKNYMRTNVYGRQMFAKIVRDDFKEVNKAVFGSVKKDNSDTLKLIEATATKPRIEKIILKLTTEGGLKLERGLMKYLVVAVIKDVFKEEGDLILKYKEIDIGLLKQRVAKQCLDVLDWRIELEKVYL
jgi:hypothetical protein